MEMLLLILMFVGFICLVLAAFNVAFSSRINLGWLGVAFFALVVLLSR
jgi:hypothetical protein